MDLLLTGLVDDRRVSQELADRLTAIEERIEYLEHIQRQPEKNVP